VRAHEQTEGEQLVTLSAAAELCGVSRSTVRRLLDRGELAGAVQDERQVWRVPVGSLAGAGLTVADTGARTGARTGSDIGGQAETGQSALTLLSQLAPLLEQLTTLQRERGDLQSELTVARFRLEQLERAEQRPGRAGAGLLLAGGALLAAGAGWALAPELHLLGAGLAAGAGLLAAGWAWLTR
jgi:hypothetical protein